MPDYGLLLANHRHAQLHHRWVCRNGVRVTSMCSEASCSFLTKQTDVTYVLNIPPQRHKVPEPCRFKAGDGVLKYFWLTFKVKQGLFCQDSAAVNLCSSESAALHTNANTARATTTAPFSRVRFKNVHRAENDRLRRYFGEDYCLKNRLNSQILELRIRSV